MATEEEEGGGPRWSGELSGQKEGASGGSGTPWERDLAPLQHSLRFVGKLEEQHACPACRAVVLHPHQASCGHVFCHRCIQTLLETSAPPPTCPLDATLIRPDEVFLDNCFRREISNLEVHCTNAPSCSHRMRLCKLKEHLKVCQYESLPCTPHLQDSPHLQDHLQLQDHLHLQDLHLHLQDHLHRQDHLHLHLQDHLHRQDHLHLQDHLHRQDNLHLQDHHTACPHGHVPHSISQLRDHEQRPDHSQVVQNQNSSQAVQNQNSFQAVQNPSQAVQNQNSSQAVQNQNSSQAVQNQNSSQGVQNQNTSQAVQNCSQERRTQVPFHEESSLSHHVLLLLDSNSRLQIQMESLQQEVLLRQQELQERSQVVRSLEREVRPLAQQVTRCDHALSTVQRSLAGQRDHISSVHEQLQELSCVLGQDAVREELGQLRTSMETLRLQLTATEGLKDHLGALEENYRRHARLLNIHTTQLGRSDERFQELESTSYDGKLIWKIQDYQKRKEGGALGLQPCLSSPPFHTGRSGYKMAARAYLSGDGDGRGTHLSLYVVLLRGDLDPLLPWPFHQTVSLSVLDQSGANNHLTLSFRPDPACNSFQRPGADATANVASGFPRFASHGQLEAPKSAVYVRDDTLFVKVKVDTSGLEEL